MYKYHVMIIHDIWRKEIYHLMNLLIHFIIIYFVYLQPKYCCEQNEMKHIRLSLHDNLIIDGIIFMHYKLRYAIIIVGCIKKSSVDSSFGQVMEDTQQNNDNDKVNGFGLIDTQDTYHFLSSCAISDEKGMRSIMMDYQLFQSIQNDELILPNTDNSNGNMSNEIKDLMYKILPKKDEDRYIILNDIWW